MWYCRTVNYRLYVLVPILMTYPCMDDSLYGRYILVWISYPHTQIHFQPRFLSQLRPELYCAEHWIRLPLCILPHLWIQMSIHIFSFLSNLSISISNHMVQVCIEIILLIIIVDVIQNFAHNITPFQFIEYFRKHLCMLI